MKLSDSQYDLIKWIAQYLLPGIASLYFALVQIWGFPLGDQIIGTIMAIDAFLGLLLGLSNNAYQKSQNGSPETSSLKQKLYSYVLPVRKFFLLIQLSNETYDKLIWVAQYLLPAISTLVFALSGIWNFQYGEQVVGTIAAIDAFLGILLGISKSQYQQQLELTSKSTM